MNSFFSSPNAAAAIARYAIVRSSKNRMWSIYFELIIFPASDSSSGIQSNRKMWICASAFTNQSNANIHSSFWLIDIYFCEFYDNAFDVWIWRMATAMRETWRTNQPTSERTKKSHLSNFIYWCWGCESSTDHFFLSFSIGFFLFFGLWLIDFYALIRAFVREKERRRANG